jgi:HPt (histidine-containing phosphotransfer) domain-containing protein
MADDLFAERLAKIRTRFAGNLPGKINSLDHALPQISGEGEAVVETLATVYRSVHEICGTGPTVGFVATGQTARSVEQILIQPLRAKRGLNDAKVAAVQERIVTLRAAARKEMQTANV